MTTETLYTTLDSVRIFNQDDEMPEGLVISLIKGVSRAIDAYCRRVFYTVAEDRLYDWTSQQPMRLRDDIISLTSLATNAGQLLVSGDYALNPRMGPPFSRVEFNRGIALRYTSSPLLALTLTGVWGYKFTVPDDIELACKAWVSDIFATSDSRGMDSMSGGGIRAAMTKVSKGPPDDVAGWLDNHKKPTRIGSIGFI